tara:strand:- start:5344 stop:8001 length:2658 start_codon:yes stop_codon:yes gene_type:complete
MRANLAERELETIAMWAELSQSEKNMSHSADAPHYTSLDAPFYPDKHVSYKAVIHRILKDFSQRSHDMMGWTAQHIPISLGHFHQLERKVTQSDQELSAPALRKKCREQLAKDQAQKAALLSRLGLQTPPNDKSLATSSFSYQAEVYRQLADLIEADVLKRQKAPVYWCTEHQISLSHAEVVHQEVETPLLFVGFPLISDPVHIDIALRGRDVELATWTTQPWTLLANQGLGLHPDAEYVALRYERKVYLVSKACYPELIERCRWKKGSVELLHTFPGRALQGLVARHPLLHQQAPILSSPRVDATTGTGCVPLAPGHDFNAYQITRDHNIEPRSIVDAQGRFTQFAGRLAGQKAVESTQRLQKRLQHLDSLLSPFKLTTKQLSPHSPYSQQPLLIRALPHWFLDLDKDALRKQTIATLRDIEIAPATYKRAIEQELRQRPDWCFTRQKTWGIPFPAFYCKRCRHPLLDPEHIRTLAQERVTKEGTDFWHDEETESLLPPHEGILSCMRCGHSSFRKEKQVLSVNFEAALAPLILQEDHPLPLSLSLESNARGHAWLQHTLLLTVQLQKTFPFSKFIAHASADIAKASTSSNAQTTQELPKEPETFIAQYGSDILRLWVASHDACKSFTLTQKHLHNVNQNYRRLRVTLQFLLGNLQDFQPQKDLQALSSLNQEDVYMLDALAALTEEIGQHYQTHETHKALQALLRYCSRELRAGYFERHKERLYTAPNEDRKTIQTVLYAHLHVLLRVMAPILCFTAEEYWQHLPHTKEQTKSVHLATFPTRKELGMDGTHRAQWSAIRHLLKTIRWAKTRHRKSSPKIDFHTQTLQLYATTDDAPAPLSEDLCALLASLAGVHSVTFQQDKEPPAQAYQSRDSLFAIEVKTC